MSQTSKTVIADETEVGTQITKNIIDAVEVNGYRLKEKELLIEDDKVRAYVLLEFPIGGYNDVLKYKAEQQAKANKDFETADKIRDQLSNVGITLKDTKDGVDWSL